jgi:ABC-type uncharacterized transport system permease subunit
MTALVLGHIALALFFMPILGGPLAAAGLLAGALGVVLALASRDANMRYSIAGVAVCVLALGVNLALQNAPSAGSTGQLGSELVQPAPGRPAPVPPARAHRD